MSKNIIQIDMHEENTPDSHPAQAQSANVADVSVEEKADAKAEDKVGAVHKFAWIVFTCMYSIAT